MKGKSEAGTTIAVDEDVRLCGVVSESQEDKCSTYGLKIPVDNSHRM